MSRLRTKNARLPKEQQLAIALDYMNTDMTLRETADKYGLSNPMLLCRWVKKFGLRQNPVSLRENPQIQEIMSKKTTTKSPTTQTEKELQDRIFELELELKKSQMQVVALNTMIDIAEEQGVAIRKKSGAKQ